MTICRAFHWLDQATVLQHLDDQVAADGAVAIFGDNSFWAAGSPWKSAVRSVIQEFLGEWRRAGQGTFNHHDRPYSEIMETTEGILGYLYSTSFAAPQLFGDRLGDFEREVKAVLAEFSDDDTFSEDNEFLVRK